MQLRFFSARRLYILLKRLVFTNYVAKCQPFLSFEITVRKVSTKWTIFTSRSIHIAIGAVGFRDSVSISISIFMGHAIPVSGWMAVSVHRSVTVSNFWCISSVIGSNRDITSVIGFRCWWNTINITEQTIVWTDTRTLQCGVFFVVVNEHRMKIMKINIFFLKFNCK